MLNLPLIYRAIGTLLYLEAFLLAACFGMGFWFHETQHSTFALPCAVAIVAGMMLSYAGRHAENRMGRRDGFLIVSLTWIVFSLVGMLPFIVGGYETRIAAAFFETMSGFTTTGASVLTNIDALPHSILLWRSLTHWLGGMGIVFFTIAVLPNMGASDLRLFSAEATGLKMDKLHPRLSTTARWLWSLYLLLTIACTAAYYLGGMSLFDAINHGFSTIATGGFSTHQQSFAWFHSERLQWIAALFMFLAGMNFTLLYLLFVKRRFRKVFSDDELRCYVGFFIVVALILAGVLTLRSGEDPLTALRHAVFTTLSLQTTTGFTDVNFMLWHPALWIILTMVGIVGACAGSTSGGLKCIRIMSAWKVCRGEFRQMLHPHAVLPLRINHSNITLQMGRTIFVFLNIYVVLMVASVAVMVCLGMPMLDAFGLATSSFSNVGPSIGRMVGPCGSWGNLSDSVLWLNSFLMLAGRLEIFSLLLPLTPSFWKDE